MTRNVLTDDDQQRVAEVFQTHQRFVEAVAAQHSPAQDVPDIVQAVAVKVCRHLNGFRGESELSTWLYRVTVNEARRMARNEGRFRVFRETYTQVLQATPDPIIDPDQVVIQNQRIDALKDAVDRLRGTHRTVACHELAGSGVQLHRRETRHRVRRKLRDLMMTDPRATD